MTYEWTHNSSPLATGTTIVLPTILSGDQISCIATATDPFGAYHTASQMVSIGNSAPEITSIILSPSSPNAQSGSISCLVSASDPDGDPITYTYEWSIDGVPQSNTSSILSGPFSHPSSITCTATASDALDSGTPQSATTSISNSLPSISGIILNPSPTYTSSTISAIYSIIDLDITQSTSATLAWHKIDGQSGIDSIVSTTGNILASSFFVKGDGIYLEVTPFDGYDLGTKVSSNLLTISNTPPTDPTVSVSPSLASAGIDDLICNVSGISTDIDGDPIDYTFVWRDANGSFAQSTTQTSLSDLYPGVLTNSGTWTCTVTANDGSDDSNPITASLSVSGACASHMDCPGGKFCAEWLTDGLLHCSDSCLDDTDCQSGSLCANLAGGSNVRYCTPFPTTTNGAGSFCTVDTDCDSGICFSGYCESHCGGETDCGVSESCHAVGNLSTGDLYSTCGMHTVYQDINQSCEINGVAGGDYCETGHCDIHQYDYYNGGSSSGFDPFCRPLCSKESDCDLSGQYPEVCDVVIVTDVPSSGVPISTLNPTPHSGITACYEPWSVGSLTTGTVCSQNTDCASNKCFNIMQGSPQRYCSAFCEDNSDCGGGTTCMTGSLSVANEWMLYHSSFSVTELQGITTLVKVCAF
jgi:hypothetical protein